MEIDPRIDRLVYDLNALIHFEEATGANIADMDWKQLGRDYKMQRALLWAGLLRNNPDITLEQVGALVDMANAKDIGLKMVRAFAAGMPVPEANAPGEETGKNPESR